MEPRPSAKASVWTLLQAAAGSHVPGPELAARLGLTRTAVWKQIRRLEALGYRIEAHPKKGYRLLASPDLILPQELALRLRTRWLGRSYEHLRVTGSTNSDAVKRAQQGAAAGTLVLAEAQTSGRGRLERTWEAPASRGLTFSFILRPQLPPEAAPQFTLAAALALARTIEAQYDLPARIKWPNDVLIHSRKVAGILTEMQSESDRIRFLAIGIGINCNQNRAELDREFRYPATSIALESGAPCERKDFLAALLAALEEGFERLEGSGLTTLVDELQKYSDVLGAWVEIERMGQTLAGRVRGLTAEGGLRLETKEGTLETIWAGDITRLTRAD